MILPVSLDRFLVCGDQRYAGNCYAQPRSVVGLRNGGKDKRGARLDLPKSRIIVPSSASFAGLDLLAAICGLGTGLLRALSEGSNVSSSNHQTTRLLLHQFLHPTSSNGGTALKPSVQSIPEQHDPASSSSPAIKDPSNPSDPSDPPSGRRLCTVGPMSVTVKHLNADSSFLLLFHPEAQPSSPGVSTSSPPLYSILIDPWLHGDSIVTAPWFAITKLLVPSCIQHLSQLDEPDLVVVSQNKPDHCHGETLRQLRPEAKTIIAAEPGAAKAIKGWDHFDPARVFSLPKFNPQKKFSHATFYIPPLSPSGHRGIVTIAFIPAKNYMTGLHNAIGITYLAPTHTKSIACMPTVDLVQKKTTYFHLPLSPPASPHHSVIQTRPLTAVGTKTRRSLSVDRPLTAEPRGAQPRLSQAPSFVSPISPTSPESHQRIPYSPPSVFTDDEGSPAPTFSTFSTSSHQSAAEVASMIDMAFQPNDSAFFAQPLPTPPETPPRFSAARFSTRHPSTSSTGSATIVDKNTVTAGRPRPLSVLYTPHGIPFKPDLIPYVENHLVKRGALPLTVLLHSFDRATNPWYLGGNITAGTEGGVQIARGLMARSWLSAHDEAKDDQGVSVRKLKTSRMTAEQVRRALWEGPEGEEMRRQGWNCDVRSLPPGQNMFIGQSRDLLAGLENKRESRLLRFGPPPPCFPSHQQQPQSVKLHMSPISDG